MTQHHHEESQVRITQESITKLCGRVSNFLVLTFCALILASSHEKKGIA